MNVKTCPAALALRFFRKRYGKKALFAIIVRKTERLNY